MSASCQGGEKGKKAVGNASKNHPLARAKQRRSNVQDPRRSRIVHARTNARHPDGPVDRPDVHPQGSNSNSNSACEGDCAGAPPYDVRPRCTRACRYLLIGTGGGQTGGGVDRRPRAETTRRYGSSRWRLALVGCVPWWWAGGAAAARCPSWRASGSGSRMGE